MSKGSRINSTHAPERYSATEPLVRFSSTPTICTLHFTVEWAQFRNSSKIEFVISRKLRTRKSFRNEIAQICKAKLAIWQRAHRGSSRPGRDRRQVPPIRPLYRASLHYTPYNTPSLCVLLMKRLIRPTSVVRTLVRSPDQSRTEAEQ
jgi:hypothetical protein